MLESLGAILAIAATWLALAGMFVGLGLLVRCLAGLPWEVRSLGALEATAADFWLGWGASIAILQFWHLGLPVDGRALLIFALLSLVGLFWGWNVLNIRWQMIAEGDPRTRRTLVGVGVAVVVLWASLALGPPENFDTGLYHMQAVRWNSAWPIVPGLGNLHTRLAYNNSSFLYAALLDVGPWSHRSHHLSNGLLSLAVLLPMLAAVPGALAPKQAGFTYCLWLTLLLPATVLWCYKQTTSYTPDLVAYLLGIVVSAALWRLLTGKTDAEANNNEHRYLTFFIVFLGAVGMTIKMSFAPLAVAASIIALVVGLGREWNQTVQRSLVRLILPVLLVAPLVIGAWMTRGVVLSGYVAFPQTIGAVDVPWRIPHETAVSERQWIASWARNRELPPEQVLDNWRWLGPWLKLQSRDFLKVVSPVICAVIGAAMTIGTRRNLLSNDNLPQRTWLVIVPSLLTIVAVLATAPDLRFAGASLSIVGATALALALDRWPWESRAFFHGRRLTLLFSTVVLVIVLVKAVRYVDLTAGLQPIPITIQRTELTNTGDKILVTDGDERAWDASLPNTPYFNPHLSQRRAGDLGSGFVVR